MNWSFPEEIDLEVDRWTELKSKKGSNGELILTFRVRRLKLWIPFFKVYRAQYRSLPLKERIVGLIAMLIVLCHQMITMDANLSTNGNDNEVREGNTNKKG